MTIEQRPVGTTGVQVSTIGLGTWAMSGAFWGAADDAESVRVIQRALDLGVTLIDTAEGYGAGHAEDVVGRALKGQRDRAVIATKVAPANLDPDQVAASLAASCKRMGTDYVDIYFVHWPNPEFPIGPTFETLERLRESGAIRALGVSNFTPSDMDIAQDHGKIDVLQPPYNMFWREVEAETLPYCIERNIGVIPYSGLAQGLLTGGLSRETVFADDDQRTSTVLFQDENYGAVMDAVDKLISIAQQRGVTVAQLAVNWLTSRPGITAGLFGPRTVKELEDNVLGVGWDLTDEEEDVIKEATLPIWEAVSHHPDMFGRHKKFGDPHLKR